MLIMRSQFLKCFTAVFLFCYSMNSFAEKSPVGLWLANSPFYVGVPIAIVKIYKMGDMLCGDLVKVLPKSGSFQMPVKIAKEGPVMMCGYHESGGMWTGGKIYEQISAKIYSSSLWLSKDGDELYVRGYVGPFYRTAVWKRMH